jgi:hypothetical protein
LIDWGAGKDLAGSCAYFPDLQKEWHLSKGHAVLRFLRKVHLYIGIFTAPALIFFAFTGAMQTFSLHETTPGSNYKPPAWIATLAQLHKKQTTLVPPRRPRPVAPEGAPGDRQRGGAQQSPQLANGGGQAAPQKSHLPMKIFFLLVAVSLLVSTLTGIYMSYKYSRSSWAVTALLMAGFVVPLVLLPF